MGERTSTRKTERIIKMIGQTQAWFTQYEHIIFGEHKITRIEFIDAMLNKKYYKELVNEWLDSGKLKSQNPTIEMTNTGYTVLKRKDI